MWSICHLRILQKRFLETNSNPGDTIYGMQGNQLARLRFPQSHMRKNQQNPKTWHSMKSWLVYMSNGLNLLHPRKDVAEMVIVFCVSLIVPEDLMFAIKSGEHVYQESSFFVSPLSFLRVSWWYQVSMSWCNCSKMSEVLAGAHIEIVMLAYLNPYIIG